MKIEEAKCFVEKFCISEYTEGEHDRFTEWVRKASLDELSLVADCIESCSFDNSELCLPSKEWIISLEGKIDKLESRNVMKGPSHSYVWARSRKFALALSIPIVIGIIWLIKREIVGSYWRPSYTIMSTEKGEHKEVKLWDGSKVWLNGASRVRYISETSGKEREVEITGEAFFDVSPEALHPFVVIVGKIKVEVLGTAFDIRNYPTEDDCSINVVDGKVKVINGSVEGVVNGREQAKFIKHDLQPQSIVVSKFDDLGGLTVWNAGVLQFSNEGIAKVVKELSISFGFEFKGANILSKNRFTGTISMGERIDDICERLQFV